MWGITTAKNSYDFVIKWLGISIMELLNENNKRLFIGSFYAKNKN